MDKSKPAGTFGTMPQELDTFEWAKPIGKCTPRQAVKQPVWGKLFITSNETIPLFRQTVVHATKVLQGGIGCLSKCHLITKGEKHLFWKGVKFILLQFCWEILVCCFFKGIFIQVQSMCYWCQADLIELKLKWSIEKFEIKSERRYNEFKFSLDIQTKCSYINNEILNVAIDADPTFKYREPNNWFWNVLRKCVDN